MTQGPEGNRELAIVQTFKNAHAEGAISAGTLNKVASKDVQTALAVASGVPFDQARGKDIHLVTFVLDNSGSMKENTDAVIRGYNSALDYLAKTPDAGKFWVGAFLLNPLETSTIAIQRAKHFLALPGRKSDNQSGARSQQMEYGIIVPYGPLVDSSGQVQTRRLDRENYQIHGMTPLYSRTEFVLLAVNGKTQEAKDARRRVTSSTMVMSDGQPQEDPIYRTPTEVAKVVDDMKGTNLHLILATGFGDARIFVPVFEGMHIDRQSILTTNSRPQEVIRALTEFAKRTEKAAAATKPNEFRLLLTQGWDATNKNS